MPAPAPIRSSAYYYAGLKNQQKRTCTHLWPESLALANSVGRINIFATDPFARNLGIVLREIR